MNIDILKAYMIWCRVWADTPSFTGLRVFEEIEKDIDTEYKIIEDMAEDNYIE